MNGPPDPDITGGAIVVPIVCLAVWLAIAVALLIFG